VPKTSLPYALKLPLFVFFLGVSGLLAGIVARFFAGPLNARLRRYLAGDAQNLA
jgi:hypothetical protein